MIRPGIGALWPSWRDHDLLVNDRPDHRAGRYPSWYPRNPHFWELVNAGVNRETALLGVGTQRPVRSVVRTEKQIFRMVRRDGYATRYARKPHFRDGYQSGLPDLVTKKKRISLGYQSRCNQRCNHGKAHFQNGCMGDGYGHGYGKTHVSKMQVSKRVSTGSCIPERKTCLSWRRVTPMSTWNDGHGGVS